MLPEGYGLVLLDEVDSTNAEVLRRAAAGARGPLWIRARRQTSGRGRQGRSWISREGNLYVSLLLEVDLDAGSATGLSLVAALAVYDTIAELQRRAAAHGRLALKWPNDVLLDGAKLSGILIEATSTGGGGAAVMAVGIGINVAHHPEIEDYRTTCLADAGIEADAAAAFDQLATCFAAWLARWDGGRGFAEVREAWIARAGGIGSEVVVRLPNERLTGTFMGLDDGGAMILREPSGRDRQIFAGDLFLASGGARDG